MTPFQAVVRLKIERKGAEGWELANIDRKIRELEPSLTHEEAVFIVKKYESDVQEIKKV